MTSVSDTMFIRDCGGASYIKRRLGPAAVTGLDFSADAVAFCRQKHQVEGLSFLAGDRLVGGI